MRTLALVLLCLLSAPAFAQRVVILEFEGDKANKLRTQIEAALKKANTVELIPVQRWKDIAARRKLKGPQAMTPAAVAKLSRNAGVDAAVEGALGDKFFVQILDSTGQELWSKELPLKKGLLSDDHAKKLAKAITAAAKTAPTSTPEGEDAPVGKGEDRPVKTSEDAVDPDQPRRPGDLSPEEKAKRRQEEEAEANRASGVREPIAPERDQDLESEGKKEKVRIAPKIIRVWLAGTTTWRSYCSRPGVASCAEYASRDPKPEGVVVNFSPEVPYAGFSLAAELFPLARTDKRALVGLGVLGSFSLGFSLTNVRVSSDAGSTTPKQVVSTDRAWSAQLAYRLFFSFFEGKDTIIGFAGIHGGVASRVFEIDPQAKVPLPGGYRTFGQIGVDGMIPLGTRFAKLELGFTYFINPRPGPDEILGYGNLDDPATGGATANLLGGGLGLDVGLSGDLWGPLGYSIKFQHSRFVDKFWGQGKQWVRCDETQCGGAAEEVYSSLVWGITASF